MPAVKFSPFGNSQFITAASAPALGHKLYAYAAGSSTLQTTYTDATGTIAQSNPVVLNALGFPAVGQIWLVAGLNYKLVWTDASDVVLKTQDNIAGVNDSATTTSQWAASGVAPIFVSATQFTLSGDQTSAFHVGRRLQFTTTAGTVYGFISVSAFTTLTTITVVMDAGVLDSGLSAVNLAVLTAVNPSLPNSPTARASMGAAASGANSDITSLSGLTTPLSKLQGGTGSTTNAGRTGVIFDWPLAIAPAGALALPLVATNVSRTTYASLFAVLGTTYGAGDGSTTFGIPFIPADYTTLQANANVGTSTVGQVIAHTHTYTEFDNPGASGANGSLSSGDAAPVTANQSGAINSTGGAANLAAGLRVLKCIWI